MIKTIHAEDSETAALEAKVAFKEALLAKKLALAGAARPVVYATA